ncbi:DUF1189 family protein [Vagococcus fessus]|uniref:DUF1189 domain-containing protein n=1 Tax=Vagococcus fessus TaxID=120370 RepID=A0A430ADH6_9ENTE|nr:DUF1189 family protein [Vagococcus fessus]RSU05252.1 hypothetical protein CBF31_04340 [Vagococcus fessus]
MSLFQLFKTAFTNPQRLLFGLGKSFPKVFLYILFLGTLLAIPIGVQVTKLVTQSQEDLQHIVEKMPEFKIKANKLTPDKTDSGFIYQTDRFMFSFDPDNKLSDKEIQSDLIGNILGFGMLDDHLLMTVNDESMISTFMPSNLISVPYSSFDTSFLNKEWFEQQAQPSKKTILFIVLAWIVAIVPVTVDLLFMLFTLSLLANIWVKLSKSPLRLSESFKLMTFSATLPVVIASLFSLFSQAINPMVFVMVLTYFIFLRVIRPTLGQQ